MKADVVGQTKDANTSELNYEFLLGETQDFEPFRINLYYVPSYFLSNFSPWLDAA